MKMEVPLSLGFIVPTCLRNSTHLQTLRDCLASIRQFYDEKSSIVVVIDFTSTVDAVSLLKDFCNVHIERDEQQVPADMLMYSFFREKRYFEKAIFLQDSMKLLKPFENLNAVADVQFLWHFTNHRLQWHVIKEPETEWNQRNGISTHDDLVLHCIKNFIFVDDFKSYAFKTYRLKEQWVGCFGCLTIMTHAFLCRLDEKTQIVKTMKLMKTNRLRRAIESLFALACQYALQKTILSSVDGLYFDGKGGGHGLQTLLIQKVSLNRA